MTLVAFLQDAVTEEDEGPAIPREVSATMRHHAIKLQEHVLLVYPVILVDELTSAEVSREQQEALAKVVDVLMSSGDGVMIQSNAGGS